MSKYSQTSSGNCRNYVKKFRQSTRTHGKIWFTSANRRLIIGSFPLYFFRSELLLTLLFFLYNPSKQTLIGLRSLNHVNHVERPILSTFYLLLLLLCQANSRNADVSENTDFSLELSPLMVETSSVVVARRVVMSSLRATLFVSSLQKETQNFTLFQRRKQNQQKRKQLLNSSVVALYHVLSIKYQDSDRLLIHNT